MFLNVSTNINKCPTANMFDMIRVASREYVPDVILYYTSLDKK